MDILIPSQEWLEYDDHAWKNIAKRIAVLQKDNIETISLLLKQFAKGMQYTFTSNNQSNRVIPPLIIDTDMPGRTMSAMYSEAEEAIILSAFRLLVLAEHSPAEEQELVFKNGDMCFKGTASDLYLLMGTEEADHTDYSARYGSQPNVNYNSVAEYDAIPIEFRGLEARLRAAEHFDMPEETKRILRLRIENAKKTASIMHTNS